MERFGLYRVSYNREPKGVLYVHAVSVGEVVIALKFLACMAPGARRFRRAGHQYSYGACHGHECPDARSTCDLRPL